MQSVSVSALGSRLSGIKPGAEAHTLLEMRVDSGWCVVGRGLGRTRGTINILLLWQSIYCYYGGCGAHVVQSIYCYYGNQYTVTMGAAAHRMSGSSSELTLITSLSKPAADSRFTISTRWSASRSRTISSSWFAE